MSTDALTTFAVSLGKEQIDAMFRRQAQYSTDDSEFVPLVEAVLTAFETVGVDQGAVEELWHHAYMAYDSACREADPEYSFDVRVQPSAGTDAGSGGSWPVWR